MSKGNFVTGLTRDDFEVFEDGKPQKIEMFSYVELPVEPPDRFACPRIAPSAATRDRMRRPFDGRVYVLVLDDLDISPLRDVARQERRRASSSSGISARTTSPRSSTRAAAPTPRRTSRAIADLLLAADRQVRRPPASVGRHRSPRAPLSSASSPRLEPARTTKSTPGADINDAGRADRHPRSRARTAGAGRARHAAQSRRVSRGRARPPQGGAAVQRGPRNADERDLRHAHARPTSAAPFKDAITAAARSNVSFFALDPRGLIGMTSEYIEIGRVGRARRGDRRIRIAVTRSRAC